MDESRGGDAHHEFESEKANQVHHSRVPTMRVEGVGKSDTKYDQQSGPIQVELGQIVGTNADSQPALVPLKTSL